MLEMLNDKDLMPDVSWDTVVDSSIEGYGKPDLKIFELVQGRIKLKKAEILFVDNNQRNINAANLFGWKTFFYDSSDYEKSTQRLEAYLIKNNII